MPNTELYLIKEDQVVLPANKWYEERAIAELKDATNQQYIIASLEDRFQELFEKVNEVKKEFDAATDKIKIAGKIGRTKSYLCTAKAIGDYTTLLTVLDTMEAEIKIDVEKALVQKEQLCIAAEELLKATELKDATEKLRNLQAEFKALPIVPDLKNEEYRERFEKAKDDFFKHKQASFENFEHDMLDNLSKKIDLCEKAESLQHSQEWKKTTDAYIALNEEWKKIGIVPKHRVEELWFRFSTAKDIFFAKKKEHIGEIVVEQEENLAKKLELIAKAEALKDSVEWKKTSEIYAQLMEDWKKIGRVPQEKSDEVWNTFLAAKNHFYKNKDNHYSDIKVQLEDNFALKMAIVKQAEELVESMDFEHATKEYLDMFEEWKKIGRTPKEYGDEAWERFQKAKRMFFNRKDEHREKRKLEASKDIQERLSRNRAFYNKVSRELQNEETLLFDLEERIQNLPPSLRSYEKREEYQDMMVDIKKKVEELRAKAKEVKEKMYQDEREVGYINRGPRAKNQQGNSTGNHKEAPNTSEPKPVTVESNDATTIEEKVHHAKPAVVETHKVEEPEVELSEAEALQNLLAKYKK